MKTLFIFLLMFVANIAVSQVVSDTLVKNLGKVNSDFVYDEDNLVLIPNTNIKMQAPEYFLISENIPGLVH